MSTERITRDLALERIRHHTRQWRPPVLDLPLFDCLGLICAEDIFAAHAAPAEARSTVDGYALASVDTRGEAFRRKTLVRLEGQIRPSTAGQLPPLLAGQAMPILTGGPLPPGADCVVPAEETETQGSGLTLQREMAAGEHVRQAGSDLQAGTRIARRGDDLNPPVLAALAVSGVLRARVYAPPRVLVLALGNELGPLSVLHEPGRMPADNLLLAAGLLRLRNVPEVTAEVCANSPEHIAQRLAETDCRCIITTGGTGPGERDFILTAAQAAGFTPLFGGLSLTPGKSMFAAARDGVLLFALPGTPWAVFALMHALVLPAMCWLRGRSLPVPGPILARPSQALAPAQLGWERLAPCTISALGAELQAQPLLDRSREARLDMLQAQGLLIVSDKSGEQDLLPMIPIWENRRGHRLD